jgi:hypothetical protein
VRDNRVEGRVAQVLSERELVINRGRDDGVRKGMRFMVLAEAPLEIRDPESGTLLDQIDREKVRVEATEVRQKISICSTYEKVVVGGALSFPDLDLFGPRREIYKTLRASDATYPPPLDPEQSFVKVGDRVVEMADRELK